MPLMESPPKAVSDLGAYRVLSETASLRVSPLCLGAMSIGASWADKGIGSMDKESSFKLLDEFVRLGGNFIDTANNYQDEDSEIFIGEWMKSKNNRDQMVIATKYTTYFKGDKVNIGVNYTGNHAKSLHISLNQSLQKLQTDYIDILYVHWWDYYTSVPEMMQNLDKVVKSGKVLYLGISDCPAWVVSKANQYARDHGMAQFVVYQGKWSVLHRDFEREIIPMARAEGMALCPWGAMGGGNFQSRAELERRSKANEGLRWGAQQTDKEKAISQVLEEVGNEVGGSVTSVALAYVMQKTPYVFPLIGGRKVEHLQANVEALKLLLSSDHIKKLEAVTSDFDLGIPYDLIGQDPAVTGKGSWIAVLGGPVSVPTAKVALGVAPRL